MNLEYKNRITGITVSVRDDKPMDSNWECLSEPVKPTSPKPKTPTKAELLAQGMELGLEVNAKMTVKELVAAIETGKQETPKDPDGSEDPEDPDGSEDPEDPDGAIITSQEY